MGEANLPAQEAQAHAHTWLPRSNADKGRPGGDQGPAAQGPSQADRLTWRIRDRATFDALTTRRRTRRGAVSLAVFDVGDGAPPRVAYSVGKRVGPSVTRNRVRRRLRAAVAGHRAQLKPGRAYLLGASPTAAAASYAELAAAVGELLGASPGPTTGKDAPR
jgi:ribonuclease P protein component